MICALFTLLLHSHLKISKIQELLQVVISSCMECLRAWARIQIMKTSILRRLHWLSQMSVCIIQACSQWTTTSESCYSYQFDDPQNVVSSFHALKCSKMDFSDHFCALLEILQSSYQECSTFCKRSVHLEIYQRIMEWVSKLNLKNITSYCNWTSVKNKRSFISNLSIYLGSTWLCIMCNNQRINWWKKWIDLMKV